MALAEAKTTEKSSAGKCERSESIRAQMPYPSRAGEQTRIFFILHARLVFKRASIFGHNELAALIAEFAHGFDSRAWIKTLTVLNLGDMGEIEPNVNHQVYYHHAWKHWQELYWYGEWQQPKFFLRFRRMDDATYTALINYSTHTLSFIDGVPTLRGKALMDDMASFIKHSPRAMEMRAKEGAELWAEANISEEGEAE